MTKNPYFNALAASFYIVAVVLVMNFMAKYTGPDNKFIAPIVFLSMFTLSTAVMGYLFVLQPLQLYLDGEKKAGVRLFLQTVGVFAVITIVVIVVLLFGIK
jgi:hypothetical protein